MSINVCACMGCSHARNCRCACEECREEEREEQRRAPVDFAAWMDAPASHDMEGGVHTAPNRILHMLRAKRRGEAPTNAAEYQYAMEDSYYAPPETLLRLNGLNRRGLPLRRKKMTPPR